MTSNRATKNHTVSVTRYAFAISLQNSLRNAPANVFNTSENVGNDEGNESDDTPIR